MINYSHRICIRIFYWPVFLLVKKPKSINCQGNCSHSLIFLFCVAMQISVCCSGNISVLDPMFIFIFADKGYHLCARFCFYLCWHLVNGFTAIPLLHNWESMYLPLLCLLIKILFCIYYLSSTNIRGTYFRDWQLQKSQISRN